MPANKMFLISGNNTGTGILQNLMDSDGTGLICESEADTIEKIVEEMMTTTKSERTTRVIDFDQEASMEQKKREGYF